MLGLTQLLNLLQDRNWKASGSDSWLSFPRRPQSAFRTFKLQAIADLCCSC